MIPFSLSPVFSFILEITPQSNDGQGLALPSHVSLGLSRYNDVVGSSRVELFTGTGRWYLALSWGRTQRARLAETLRRDRPLMMAVSTTKGVPPTQQVALSFEQVAPEKENSLLSTWCGGRAVASPAGRPTRRAKSGFAPHRQRISRLALAGELTAFVPTSL